MSIRCEACHEKYQECAVRECPKKPGHYICQYCCMKCKRSYAGYVGRGCVAFDRMKAENAEVVRNEPGETGGAEDAEA